MELNECRVRIDEIDTQIVALLEERMDVCKAIGIDKYNKNLEILDSNREKEKIGKIREMTKCDSYKDHMEQIYTEVMAQSRLLQKDTIERLKSKKAE